MKIGDIPSDGVRRNASGTQEEREAWVKHVQWQLRNFPYRYRADAHWPQAKAQPKPQR